MKDIFIGLIVVSGLAVFFCSIFINETRKNEAQKECFIKTQSAQCFFIGK